ncbi:MAG TPA: beta-ketoacyl-ACP synthase II [Phycisphaerae bacterium]|nr:beta-ketoacyl-ACP synthase II [Phycisphaerae bacterium]
MGKRRVVITGMGVITPLGCSVQAYWDNLVAGRSGIGPLTLFDATQYSSRIAGECRDFRIEEWIEDGRISKRMDRFAQFAVASAIQAVKDTGLDIAAEDPYRIGAIVGSGIGGILELQTQHLRLREKGPSKISAFTIPKLMLNAGSGNISIHFGIRGPSTAVATACASATNAMGDAFRSIQRGEADIMITGGSEAAVVEISVAAFSAMHALSTRNDQPTQASRPFDKGRDGFVISEGAGVLIFEELERAQKRGARIYAEVLGYGLSSDGGHIAQPDETGTGAAAAMRHCMTDAGLSTNDLDYINAHGTGTALGDVAETKAVKQVLGDRAYKVPVSSTKSATGHLLGASGGIELVATVMAIHTGVLPPTINLDTPDPDCDLDYVPNKARECKVRRAMSNSFGFGGHNACILVGDLG